MVNKNKIKGSQWERDAAKLLNESFPDTWRRNPGSGALGTLLELPILKGDVVGDYEFLPFDLVAEAKVGYGGTQMQIQKEWFDKIKEQAGESYALPVVLLKFEKARTGTRHVIAMDFETWDKIMTYIESMHEELLKLYEQQETKQGGLE
jgi:Holliday junction resolvase